MFFTVSGLQNPFRRVASTSTTSSTTFRGSSSLRPVDTAHPGKVTFNDNNIIDTHSWTFEIERSTITTNISKHDSLERAINIAKSYSKLFLKREFDLSQVLHLRHYCMELQNYFDKSRAIEVAEKDANGFIWPTDIHTRDINELISLEGNLIGMVELHQKNYQTKHFNEERCRQMFADDEQFTLLLDLAVYGARIFRNINFVPCITPEKPRKMHLDLTATLRKHITNQWFDNKVLVFPTEQFTTLFPNVTAKIHNNVLHWAIKPPMDKNPQGRPCSDCSNRKITSPLNSVFATERLRAYYGDIHLPTIITSIDSWYKFAESKGINLSTCLLWKNDVKSGFNQFLFESKDTLLMCVPLDGMTIMSLVGTFGWGGSSFIFDVFSRALKRKINNLTNGTVDVYVDDIYGVSPSNTADFDQAIAENAILDCFGPESLSDKIDRPSSCMDVIGYEVNLLTETIKPNQKSIRKLMFIFLSFDFHSALPIHLCQAMASLAERYSHVLLGTRPFVQPLHSLCRQKETNTLHISRHANSEQRFCMEIWAAIAVLLYINSDSLAVPLRRIQTLKPNCNDLFLISDASPHHISIAIYSHNETELLMYMTYRLPYTVPNDKVPGLQNAREYLGLTLGFACLQLLNRKFDNIHWTGDNISALSWAHKEKTTSNAAQFSLLFNTWFQIYNNFRIMTSHRAGILMGDIDSISRLRKHSLPSHLEIHPSSIPNLDKLFMQCNILEVTNLRDHHLVLSDVIQLVTSFSSIRND